MNGTHHKNETGSQPRFSSMSKVQKLFGHVFSKIVTQKSDRLGFSVPTAIAYCFLPLIYISASSLAPLEKPMIGEPSKPEPKKLQRFQINPTKMYTDDCVLQRSDGMTFSPKAYPSWLCLYRLVISQPYASLFVLWEGVGAYVVYQRRHSDYPAD